MQFDVGIEAYTLNTGKGRKKARKIDGKKLTEI